LEQRAAERWRGHRLTRALFFALTALALLFAGRGQIEGDGIARWEALDALMSEGRLTDDKYSIVQPLFAAPCYAAGRLAAAAVGAPPERRAEIVRRVVKRFNKMVAFALVVWLVAFLRRRAQWPFRHAAAAGLFLLFGSLLIPNAKDFYSECLWTLLCALALTQAARIEDRPFRELPAGSALLFVAAIALSVPLNPILAPVFALTAGTVALGRAWGARPRSLRAAARAAWRPDLLLTAAALLLGTGLCLGENMLRRGAALDFGYPGEGFSTPLWRGLWGQIASPARGILFFAPTFFCGLFLLGGARRRLAPTARRLVVWSLVFCGFLLLAYSKWHAWHGAWYWGPRFLLPLSVFGSLYYVLLFRDAAGRGAWTFAALVALGVASFMIYKTGVAIGQGPLIECLRQHPAGDFCFWRWKFLPFASWADPAHLLDMLGHRSTAVELVVAAAAAALWRREKRSGNGDSRKFFQESRSRGRDMHRVARLSRSRGAWALMLIAAGAMADGAAPGGDSWLVRQPFTPDAWARRSPAWAGDFEAWEPRASQRDGESVWYLQNAGGEGTSLSLRWMPRPCRPLRFEVEYGWMWGGGGGRGTLDFGAPGVDWRLQLTFCQQPGDRKYAAVWTREGERIEAPPIPAPDVVDRGERSGGAPDGRAARIALVFDPTARSVTLDRDGEQLAVLDAPVSFAPQWVTLTARHGAKLRLFEMAVR
jgi:hypothetical protein